MLNKAQGGAKAMLGDGEEKSLDDMIKKIKKNKVEIFSMLQYDTKHLVS